MMIDLRKEEKRIMELQKLRKVNIDDFSYGDNVRFSFNGMSDLMGRIAIKDRYGGGCFYGMCSSVDILGDDNTLYKHVPIVDIELVGDMEMMK